MALTFPRDMTTARRWSTADLTLQRRQQFSRTRGGLTLGADLGHALWLGAFQTFPARAAEVDAILADFETLGGLARPFFVHPAFRARPLTLAAGATLPGLTVEAIRSDRSAVRIAGLPAGFVLTAGDWFSVTTAAGGREAARLATGGTADSAGLSPFVEIYPGLRVNVKAKTTTTNADGTTTTTPGDAVALVNPLLEMTLTPGTLERIAVGGPQFAVAFQCQQRVR